MLASRGGMGKIYVLTERHADRPSVSDEHGARIYRLLVQRDTRPEKSRTYWFLSQIWTYLCLMTLVPFLIVRHRIRVLHFTRYLKLPFFLTVRFIKAATRAAVVLDLRATVEDPGELARIGWCDHVICNSEAVFDQVKRIGLRAQGFGLVENPMIFSDGYGERQLREILMEVSLDIAAPYFAHVGQLLERKATLEVLGAFKEFKEKNPKYKLVIAGRNMLGQRAVTAMANIEGVVYVGPVPHSQAIAIMQGSEAVLQPSRLEGIPRVSLEALALGKKVLLPACVPEFVRCCRDFTASAESQEAILAAMERIVAADHPPKYDLNRHDPVRSIDKVVRVYRRILACNSGAYKTGERIGRG